MAQPHIVDDFFVALELDPGEYQWCACGLCRKQPFADAGGCKNGFAAVAFRVVSNKRLKICQCKHSKRPPYCDNAHCKL